MAESTTTFRKIREIQTRVRRRGDPSPGKLPKEDDQFLVWLEGLTHYFFVPIKTAAEPTMELEMMAMLREAFLHDKPVKLGYRKKSGNRYISAAWVKR